MDTNLEDLREQVMKAKWSQKRTEAAGAFFPPPWRDKEVDSQWTARLDSAVNLMLNLKHTDAEGDRIAFLGNSETLPDYSQTGRAVMIAGLTPPVKRGEVSADKLPKDSAAQSMADNSVVSSDNLKITVDQLKFCAQ